MTDDPHGSATSTATSPDGVTSVTPSDDPSAPPTSLAARPLVGAVRVYQYVAAGRPSPCRHDPSCSAYAVEALQVHGAAKGSWLAVRRLARCHPWGTQGYDPVPQRSARRTTKPKEA